MPPLATAAIIAVGSELLSPWRLDTNSLTVTARLQGLGIVVRGKAIVGDRASDLATAFRQALAGVDLVVLTGGLGPTDDDVTRDVVAAVLGLSLTENPTITEAIRQRFARRKLVMPEANRRQAMVPAGARILTNPNGTAPGLWIDAGEKAVMLLPGPPRELVAMLDGPGREELLRRAPGTHLGTRVVRVFGRSESHTEDAVRPLYKSWAEATPPIDVTILAARGAIDVHLTTNGPSQAAVDTTLADAASRAAALLGEDVYSDDGVALEEVVGRLLTSRGWRIAAAESCTGGLVLKRLTDIPGSSGYVDSGVVAYSNAAKTALLGVPGPLIAAEGAVSEAVAEAMAAGIRAKSRAEVGVGVTGIAGPSGGSEAKPVGTVVFAVETPETVAVRTRLFTGDRELVREIATNAALDLVRRVLTGRHVP
jgi:nicotinamide-nucleotide amidase